MENGESVLNFGRGQGPCYVAKRVDTEHDNGVTRVKVIGSLDSLEDKLLGSVLSLQTRSLEPASLEELRTVEGLRAIEERHRQQNPLD